MLSGNSRNIKFALRLWGFFGNECRRSEDKAHFVNALKLLFQLLISLDRKAGNGDRQLAAFMYSCLQIISYCMVDVIYNLHFITLYDIILMLMIYYIINIQYFQDAFRIIHGNVSDKII